jgi:hypothetical protein
MLLNGHHLVSSPSLRLPLVLPQHELSGMRSSDFERAVKSCRVGDAVHHALLFAGETIATRALHACLPPSERNALAGELAAARSWAIGKSALGDVRRARSRVFDRARDAELGTLAALASALDGVQGDPLDRQGAITARRYVGRGVHHAIGSLLFVLDAVTEPRSLLPIAEETAGAMAFTRIALGPARSAELRAAAREQAEWEAQRLAGNVQPEVALSLQLYHEYLGALWKDHADAQRAYIDGFLEWVFGRG